LCSFKVEVEKGEPGEEDYQVLEKCLEKLHELWGLAQLNFTPKMHSLVKHGPEHMHHFESIGDMLEDDIEHMHQMSARVEARISRMKNKSFSPFKN
jgi:hypothetical protein